MVLLVAMLSVNYLPDKLFHDFPFEPSLSKANDYDSVIPQWNTKLSDNVIEYIQLNNILGPESIAFSRSGLLYTGLADGRLVELDPSNKYKVRPVLRFKDSPLCTDNVARAADHCGRFLQLRSVNDTLYAVEATNGLFKINIKAGTKTLVGPKPLNKVNFYNSFAFDPKEPNLVYLTISSSKWDLQHIMWSIMELEVSGQLVVFDTKTGKRAIILDKLPQVNGVDVDAKRDRLVFAETASSQINTVSLQEVRDAFKSAKDGAKLTSVRKTNLIPLLPGLPDNINVHSDIAYITIPFVKPNGKEMIDELASMPTLRKALARITFGAGKLLEYVCKNFYYHPLLDFSYRELKSGHINYRITQNDKSAVIEYNLATGSTKFMGSNAFGFVSEAVPDNQGNLLLGSFRSPFIVKVKV